MKAVIGVDIGTQGTKAAAFGEDGKLLARAFRKSSLHQPSPGVVEEDPERQLAAVCETVRECARGAERAGAKIAALATAGQMAGIIGLDANGRNITPYDSWLDTRCTPYIAKMQRLAADEIAAKTGGPASFNHGPKILWWMHEHPDTFRSIRAFVQPGGYAAMRLGGLSAKEAFIDRTYLHFTGFADNARGCWDGALCDRFGLDPEKLPHIAEPSAVIGELTRPMARRCGLPPYVPLVAGCGDTAASFLACGATQEGTCVDVAGTASVFAATTRQFRPDKRQKILSFGRAATPGLWHPYAYINGGGMNLDWFRSCILAAGRTFTPEIADLDREARSIAPTPDLPMFVPHFGGRVSPSWPNLRGAWAGLSWSHTAAHLWRALLEGVALEYAIYRQALIRLRFDLTSSEMRVTGGGEKSALWNQLKADALGMPVVQVDRTEGAPLGSALLAAYGVGLIKDLDATARKWIRTGAAYQPDPALAGYYQERLDRYGRLVEALNAWGEPAAKRKKQ
jgi:xylulokinase